MSKKSAKRKQFNNRLLYSLIALGILMIVAVGVYAANTLLTPGVAPSVGHNINQLSPPSGCSAGQVLQWNGSANANGGWSCALSLPSCSNGQTLDYSNGAWICTAQSSVSHATALYQTSSGAITLVGSYTTPWSTSSCGTVGGSYPVQYCYPDCNGNCGNGVCYSPSTCYNTLLGYLVN